ncbi:OB-fold nucleic acid binding domain-containing protein [Bradyrhizobium niftali]|uniref:OB-fold nucleic acid binding domain-containing protein n=1 Tax=Bradyrhizobium niftali TaxID=2560055 RepID=UPI001ADDA28C|nr:OB-fold nucleic acid binding domain-containing protein [Bradyrhizobium niftali]
MQRKSPAGNNRQGFVFFNHSGALTLETLHAAGPIAATSRAPCFGGHRRPCRDFDFQKVLDHCLRVCQQQLALFGTHEVAPFEPGLVGLRRIEVFRRLKGFDPEYDGLIDGHHILREEVQAVLWAIKSLRSDTLPLFAEADKREQGIQPEITETPVALPPMTKGREVVEDYRSHGLTLRAHPLAFLREELTRRAISPCRDLQTAGDGSRISVAGLVLVRQKPGSAKGVMFITLEDETDIANLIVWPSLFDKLRRTILGAQMMTVRGKVQCANGVVHLIAEHLLDETELLNSVGGSNGAFVLPAGRGDEARHSSSPDPRGDVPIRKVRDIYIPDLHIDTLNVKARIQVD